MNFTKDLVRTILKNPHGFDWSLQGFGMLRTYLAPEIRLHIWDGRFQVSDVTLMHTHPWNFHSLVVAGRVDNIRFLKDESGMGRTMMEQEIQCGVGGGVSADPVGTFLRKCEREMYYEGDTYTQKAHEIHMSLPQEGSVTIIEREFLDDTEHAYVYYERNSEWVSAEPRPAEPWEVGAICGSALLRWFS